MERFERNLQLPCPGRFLWIRVGSGEPQNNFEPLNDLQIAVARSIFGMISAATNLTLTEIEETASTHADIRLAMSGAAEIGWTYTLDEAGAGERKFLVQQFKWSV